MLYFPVNQRLSSTPSLRRRRIIIWACVRYPVKAHI